VCELFVVVLLVWVEKFLFFGKVVGIDDVFVGWICCDLIVECGFVFFFVSDNLCKGVVLNVI